VTFLSSSDSWGGDGFRGVVVRDSAMVVVVVLPVDDDGGVGNLIICLEDVFCHGGGE
jgi:hypothetical protein